MQTCGNCNGMIGNMEPIAAWQGQVVCAACYERLSPQGIGANVPAVIDPLDQLAAQLPQQVQARHVQAWPGQQVGPISPWEETPPQQQHVNAPNYNNQQVVIHNYIEPRGRRRRRDSGLKNTGITLTLVSLPLFCVFAPAALVLFIVGIVLWVVGSFD
jgi:hypothetical protein